MPRAYPGWGRPPPTASAGDLPDPARVLIGEYQAGAVDHDRAGVTQRGAARRAAGIRVFFTTRCVTRVRRCAPPGVWRGADGAHPGLPGWGPVAGGVP